MAALASRSTARIPLSCCVVNKMDRSTSRQCRVLIACASAALAVVLVPGAASRAADDTQAANVSHEPRQPKLPAPPPAPAPNPDRPAPQPRPPGGTAQRPLLADDDY